MDEVKNRNDDALDSESYQALAANQHEGLDVVSVEESLLVGELETVGEKGEYQHYVACNLKGLRVKGRCTTSV